MNDPYEKLKRLKKSLPTGVMSAADLLRQKEEEPLPEYPDMTAFIPGEVRECEAGTCFVADEIFPFNDFIGNYPIERLQSLQSSNLLKTFDLEEGENPEGPILFVDTETTGLAGGTGTFAFQVGVGWIEEEGFRVLQFFMRDYDEEPGQMAMIGELFSKASMLVTYNGGTFDLPLLRTRFVFNRVRVPLMEIPHLDLLPVARRLWKTQHGRANLSFLEEKILEDVREGDVPGSLIPSLYFQFTRGASPRTMVPVFYHNRMDIVALAALTEKALTCHREPESIENEWERLGVARFHEKRGREQVASEILAPLRRTEIDPDCWHLAARTQAMLCKKLGDLDRALDLWWEVFHHGPFDPLVYIELAKHLEHKSKDLDEAKQVVFTVFEKYGIEPDPETDEGESLFGDDLELDSGPKYDYSEGVRGWRDDLPSRYVDEDPDQVGSPKSVFSPPRLTARFQKELNRRYARLLRKLRAT
ncbi:MAG: ribonuclease H-like domain-containing protein [Candidatus Omnitrophica bacterium]|nr:ribonuclease H-like domain-containing protein [Candidatus Omnitrophota bacterium]